ncbi:hypothetical protein B0T17DRAFT_525726, partial [Bombardia bombarda]
MHYAAGGIVQSSELMELWTEIGGWEEVKGGESCIHAHASPHLYPSRLPQRGSSACHEHEMGCQVAIGGFSAVESRPREILQAVSVRSLRSFEGSRVGDLHDWWEEDWWEEDWCSCSERAVQGILPLTFLNRDLSLSQTLTCRLDFLSKVASVWFAGFPSPRSAGRMIFDRGLFIRRQVLQGLLRPSPNPPPPRSRTRASSNTNEKTWNIQRNHTKSPIARMESPFISTMPPIECGRLGCSCCAKRQSGWVKYSIKTNLAQPLHRNSFSFIFVLPPTGSN